MTGLLAQVLQREVMEFLTLHHKDLVSSLCVIRNQKHNLPTIRLKGSTRKRTMNQKCARGEDEQWSRADLGLSLVLPLAPQAGFLTSLRVVPPSGK